MNSLRSIQTACYRAFAKDDTTALSGLVRDDGVAPQQRIEIYRNNNREIYRKALAASYPVIERLVGDTCFAGLAREYTRVHPSRRGDLQRFGTDFAALLERTYANSQFSYLSSVANLEWALEEVHLEPDERPLAIPDLNRFAQHEYGDLVFRVRRAVRLVGSRFPSLSIWRANQPGHNDRVDLDPGGENVAVVRHGDDLQMHPLDDDAFALATQLAAGMRLQGAWSPPTRNPAGNGQDAAPDLAAALRTVLSLGLFAAVTPGGAPTVSS